MAIRLADIARPNNYVDAEHLGTFPVAYAEDIWFSDGTRLSEYEFEGGSIQKEELPLASVEEMGKIYQYVGADGTYKSGHFYKCVENSGSYAWNEIDFVVNPVVYSATEPVASDYEAGSVVVYTGEDTTDFKKGHQYKKDGSDLVDIGGCTEVVANPVGTATYTLSKISIDGTIYDVSTIQVEALPTASATLVGKIYQYVGATTASLTNGYFYQCTQVAGSYVWIQKNVQNNDGAAVEYTTAIPIGSDIKDKFYRVNDGTDDLGLYAGNEDAQTTERVALYDDIPEEVPHWSGTRAEYEAIKDTLEAGTYVSITDDYDEGLEVVDEVEEDNMNPVTSNAVYEALSKIGNNYTSTVAEHTGSAWVTKSVTVSNLPKGKYLVFGKIITDIGGGALIAAKIAILTYGWGSVTFSQDTGDYAGNTGFLDVYNHVSDGTANFTIQMYLSPAGGRATAQLMLIRMA